MVDSGVVGGRPNTPITNRDAKILRKETRDFAYRVYSHRVRPIFHEIPRVKADWSRHSSSVDDPSSFSARQTPRGGKCAQDIWL
jgi:hypothetical protein